MRCLVAQHWVAATSTAPACSGSRRFCLQPLKSSTSSYLGQRFRPLQLHLEGERRTGGTALQQRRCRQHTQRVQASFFGVGAPEAVLVGVVSLIVFGPRGLAEVQNCWPAWRQAVKSLGKTLKAFQPTIRELASVSSDLKNTLEEQIGLDDIRAEFRNSTAPVRRASSVTDQANGLLQDSPEIEAALEPQLRSFPSDLPSQTLLDPEIQRKREQSAAAAWGAGSNASSSAPPVRSPADGEDVHSSSPGPDLSSRSLEELEAELERRRAKVKM